jgi:hypothetical protein
MICEIPTDERMSNGWMSGSLKGQTKHNATCFKQYFAEGCILAAEQIHSEVQLLRFVNDKARRLNVLCFVYV